MILNPLSNNPHGSCRVPTTINWRIRQRFSGGYSTNRGAKQAWQLHTPSGVVPSAKQHPNDTFATLSASSRVSGVLKRIKKEGHLVFLLLILTLYYFTPLEMSKRFFKMRDRFCYIFHLILIFLTGFITLSLLHAANIPGNRFILAQLKTRGGLMQWDPYPLVARDILSFLQQTTSIKTISDRRVVSLDESVFFQSPFIIYSGAGQCSWTKEEIEFLKRYLTAGGFLFVEDRAGEKGGSFDYSFRNEMKKIFPDKPLTILPREHPVFRSFYLLRSVAGRKLTNNYLEGVDVGGRTVLVYSQNDILGAWAKDLFGNFLFPCNPGGEAQRWESQKLMINVILYSLTGSYKSDSVHSPFIEEKLRR